MTKTFPAKTEALPDILGFVEEALEMYDCPNENANDNLCCH